MAYLLNSFAIAHTCSIKICPPTSYVLILCEEESQSREMWAHHPTSESLNTFENSKNFGSSN